MQFNLKLIRLNSLVFCAFCSAITCVVSMISIPIGIVPITLGIVGPLLSGGLLGAKLGALSQLVYLILVLVGFPCTAGFKAGLSVFLGPTGGYLIGYVFMAMLTGFFYKISKANCANSINSFRKIVFMVLSGVAGTFACYVFGLAHFMIVTKYGFAESVKVCVVPFLAVDFLKICLVSVVVTKLERMLHI